MEASKRPSEAALGFPVLDGRLVLLGTKMRHIGAGWINGYGGGRKLYESFAECMARELEEGCGLVADPEEVDNVAVLYVSRVDQDGNLSTSRILIYLIPRWTGKVSANTVEMHGNGWHEISELPFRRMTPDLRAWLPEILSGERLIINVRLGPNDELLGLVEIWPADNWPEDWPHH